MPDTAAPTPVSRYDYPVTADALMRGPTHYACRVAVVWPLAMACRRVDQLPQRGRHNHD